MKAYLLTHGETHGGHNPGHTANGLKQLMKIAREHIAKLEITEIVLGSGRRFQDAHACMVPFLPSNLPTKYCLFCGNGDSQGKDGLIAIQASGMVPAKDYVGIANAPGFDAYKFIEGFPPGTLFIAGREFMEALRLEMLHEPGQLYELDTVNWPRGKKIS